LLKLLKLFLYKSLINAGLLVGQFAGDREAVDIGDGDYESGNLTGEIHLKVEVTVGAKILMSAIHKCIQECE
jgi:hypothetical protein